MDHDETIQHPDAVVPGHGPLDDRSQNEFGELFGDVQDLQAPAVSVGSLINSSEFVIETMIRLLECVMPGAQLPLFRRHVLDAVALGNPVRQVTMDLGVSDPCLRHRLSVDYMDVGRKEGLISAERIDLVELRRRNRVSRWKWRS